mgnify:CR=1 FL=1
MTSEENNDEIVEFFEEHNYFDYPKKDVMFFKQGQMPLIDEKGKLLISENKMIKEASDGNGGIFKSMAINGCLADMEKRGVKWVFIGSTSVSLFFFNAEIGSIFFPTFTSSLVSSLYKFFLEYYIMS